MSFSLHAEGRGSRCLSLSVRPFLHTKHYSTLVDGSANSFSRSRRSAYDVEIGLDLAKRISKHPEAPACRQRRQRRHHAARNIDRRVRLSAPCIPRFDPRAMSLDAGGPIGGNRGRWLHRGSLGSGRRGRLRLEPAGREGEIRICGWNPAPVWER